MGQWGGGIFESDHVLDLIAGSMSTDLKVNMNFIGDSNHYAATDPECTDKDCAHTPNSKSVKKTRDFLNKGHFTRVFNKYKSIDAVDMYITGAHACCVLAAKAMSVGADITTEQREYLRSVYKKCGMHKEGIWQMGKALDDYRNKHVYELAEPDRTDHNIAIAFDDARSKAIGGMSMMNYHGARYYAENVPTHDFTHGMVKKLRRKNGEPVYFPGAPFLRECTTCDKFPEQVEGGLKFCANCKKVMYCSQECQKKNWSIHKKYCKDFAAMPEPPATDTLRSSPMCIPGYDPLANGPTGPPGSSKGPSVYTTSMPFGST